MIASSPSVPSAPLELLWLTGSVSLAHPPSLSPLHWRFPSPFLSFVSDDFSVWLTGPCINLFWFIYWMVRVLRKCERAVTFTSFMLVLWPVFELPLSVAGGFGFFRPMVSPCLRRLDPGVDVCVALILSLSWCLDAAAAWGSGEEATRLPGPFWVTWRWLLYSLARHTFPALEQERKLTPGSLGSTGGKYIRNRLRSLPPEDPIFLKPQFLKVSFIFCKVPRGWGL